ncbi:MAG: ABC transporter ATP-binding protein [Chloroflexi bacterium]|nr:ABC transporter ATP-binding protein [Chloroflexota bacterium]
MQPIIVTENLSRHFGETVAVDGLTLEVPEGQVFGFLGPNGAGKTTTVRLLNGILAPTAGRAWVMGWDVAERPNEVRRHAGVLTEAPGLYEALTARENLLFFGDLYGVPEEELAKRVEELLEEFELAPRGDDKVGTYSKGMRQRLAIARALLHRPPLLFLDEPTSGLDPAAARMVTRMIERLSRQEGRTVFLCTHNLTEAQRLCDLVGVIDHGVLRAIGTPQELAGRLWQGVWVDIDLHGEPSLEISRFLDAHPLVHSHGMEDGRLRLRLESEEAIPTLVADLARFGARIYAVIPIEHTLEEIYFRIQAGEGQRT